MGKDGRDAAVASIFAYLLFQLPVGRQHAERSCWTERITVSNC